jgi:hypothetical protein
MPGIELLLKKYKVLISVLGTIVVPILGYLFFSGSTNTTYGDQSPILTGDNSTVTYSDSSDPNFINPRREALTGLSPLETVYAYFDTLNKGEFREACSLRPKLKCDSENGEKIIEFSKEPLKYVNGYENLAVWQPSVSNVSSEIICAKYSYLLKADSNPQNVWEVVSFYMDRREDGEWEATSIACEKKFKEGTGDRICPVVASRNYCS